MSTAPLSAQDTSTTSYWQLPATKWDAVKFFSPFVMMLAWALIILWFRSEAEAQTNVQQQTAIVQFRDAKEDRGTRLSVNENEVKGLRDDLREVKDEMKEMRADIKLLLQKGK